MMTPANLKILFILAICPTRDNLKDFLRQGSCGQADETPGVHNLGIADSISTGTGMSGH
jgi:hypothetical protein